MIKKRTCFLLTLACATLCLAGAILPLAIFQLQDNVTILPDGSLKKNFSVKLSDLYPGSVSAFTLRLDGVRDSGDDRYLRFCDGSGELKDSVTLTISTEEITLSKPLSVLLAEETPVFLGRLAETVTIVCTVPLSVGNEAQGTTVRFFIELSAERK